jgi:hypothetical protein
VLLLSQSRIGAVFREVHSSTVWEGREVLIFEQITPIPYNDRPSDKIDELVAPIRPLLWRTILSQRPYRQYYLYPAPPVEHGQVLPRRPSSRTISRTGSS